MQVVEPALLAVAKRPAAQEEGTAGEGLGGGGGGAGAGGEGTRLGEAHTKGHPCGHHTMGQPLVSRP